MKINRFDSVHSANSYQSKPLLQSVAQTKLSAQSVVSDKLSMLNNHIEVGLYLAMTLSDLFTKINVSFNTVTKRLEENKKKYDKLSALVKPVDEVVEKMTQAAIDHAGDPKFADPITSSSGLTDDELQNIIDLVYNLQPSSTLTLAQLKDVSTALKLSELRSIVNDGKKKMLALSALKDTDVIEIKKQVSNIQVLSEFF